MLQKKTTGTSMATTKTIKMNPKQKSNELNNEFNIMLCLAQELPVALPCCRPCRHSEPTGNCQMVSHRENEF